MEVDAPNNGTEATESAADAEMKPEGEQVEESEPKREAVWEEEKDAAEDARPRIADVCWSSTASTPNALLADDGRFLTSLTSSGFQFLHAGVRCTVGIKAGRYVFEVKVVEMLNPSDEGCERSRIPTPRHTARIGFSLASSTTLLDEESDEIYFDTEGYFVNCGTRRKVSQRPFRHEQVLAVLLNLDQSCSDVNTVSLFCDGWRVCEPQKIADGLLGKPLFPTITFKNMTLYTNFGPTPRKPLPFKCRMLRDAAAEDVVIPSVTNTPEVLFPIGLPDQGVFSWLDGFLAEHPAHELSDRALLEWARKSGFRPRGFKTSHDKPEMNFGIPPIDDGVVNKTMSRLSPTLKRNFVCMELRGNLMSSERSAALARFPKDSFKRVAVVVVGQPPAPFVAKVHEKLLAEKVSKVEKEREIAAADAAWRKKADAKRREDEGGNGDVNMASEEKEEGKDDSVPQEEKKDEPIELTEEEKAQWFLKDDIPDLAPAVLTKSFAGFSLPADNEGFDEVRYLWYSKEAAEDHFKKWLLDLKRTTRVEDLEPSTWFKGQWEEWQRKLNDWKKHQVDAKEAWKRRGSKVQQKTESKENGNENPEDGDKDGKEQSGKEDGKAEEDVKEIDEEEIDPLNCENVLDIGDGRPLFHDWVYEDWTLLSLRYELHLLVHAFRRDMNDPDRPNFIEQHLGFYYSKYFDMQFTLKNFGFERFLDLTTLIKDSVTINPDNSFIEASEPENTGLEKFIGFTEYQRRERQRSIDAGDESAQLHFTRPSAPPRQQYQQRGSGRDRGQYRGSSGHDNRGGYNSSAPPANKRAYTPPPPAYPNKYSRGSEGGETKSRGSYAPQSRGGYSGGKWS